MNISAKITLIAIVASISVSVHGTLHAQSSDSTHRDIFTRLSQPGKGGAKVTLKGTNVEAILGARIGRSKTPQIGNGWRIRIFRDNRQDGRSRAEYIVNRIKSEHPGTSAYASYEAPYWYVAVGDYRTREDAEKMKRTIARTYPTASLINTTINLPPL